MSRLQLARDIDFLVGPQQIARYESGETTPSLDTALRVAAALGVEMSELIDAEG